MLLQYTSFFWIKKSSIIIKHTTAYFIHFCQFCQIPQIKEARYIKITILAANNKVYAMIREVDANTLVDEE